MIDRQNAYVSSIPANARQQVVLCFADGSPRKIDYYLGEERVGERHYYENGTLNYEQSYSQGQMHGWQYYFECGSGQLMWAEPWEQGLIHGTSRQWDRTGRLVGTYTLEHGTGTDLWWQYRQDGSAYLAEVHPFVDGSPHGIEWWLNEKGDLTQETCWDKGGRHGIERHWNGEYGLRRGYPRYYVDDLRVTKSQYLRAAALDQTLLPFRADDNRPKRVWPDFIVCLLNGQTGHTDQTIQRE
jgi:hypothetical protein